MRESVTRMSAAIIGRARALLWLCFAASAALFAWQYYTDYEAAQQGERPVYTDYTHTYAASLLIRETPPEYLYHPANMTAAMRAATQLAFGGALTPAQEKAVGFSAWMHPPTFILVVLPLAYMPYLLSFLVWNVVTVVPYLAALRRILPTGGALALALAAPPVYFNLVYGQTGFLIGGLIGLGLALLHRHPTLAGILIGLASVKPHLGVLIPLALLAGRHWQAFGVATITTVGLIVASVFLFGMDPWYAFIGTFGFHLEGFQQHAFSWRAMTTVLSSVYLVTRDLGSAWIAQYMVAALVALIVAWAWSRDHAQPAARGLQAAILCAGTPLVVPMAYLYDLTLLVPAAAWIWTDIRHRGGRVWESAAWVLSLAAILSVRLIYDWTGLQVGTLFVAALFSLALYRYLQVPAPLKGRKPAVPEFGTAPCEVRQ